tara:strand:- start:411 stop:1391 length:981 start_codon:yes stop_codon:yes gene_type:complete
MAIEKRDSNAVLSPDGIREQISDLDIFMHYCSPFKSIGKKFNSELRDDIKPSSIISLVKGTPRYMDFGEPDHRFDSIGYVQYKFSLTFSDTLLLINNDFNLGLASSRLTMKGSAKISGKNVVMRTPTPTIIQIKARPLNRYDRKYWGDFGISEATLASYHVVPISHFWINGTRFAAEKLAYAYTEYGKRIKIYQPNSERKWFSNVKTNDIQGIYNVPIMGSKVILTSSLKDVMVLSELTIPAVALQSEMMIPHPKVIALLKRKFEHVEVLYDNDFNKKNNPGQTMAMKICAKYDLKNIVIPEHYGEKDPSDLRKIHGKEALIKLLK